ncbi:MAG: exodeoxyribonuclease VII large subunit [Anaerolineae bacterium]|jgi:exodeoxyribonuclease VII large subunit|nr:exodeoxyribonuclease VII large subunit [Anaerolineae bacterium]
MWNQLDLFAGPESPYSVSEITGRIRNLLEQDAVLQNLWVAGEVSNFTRASSGHVYFTLKDAGAQLACVIWRAQAQGMAFIPRSGDQLVVHGHLGVYEAGGRYQLYVDRVQPAGQGSLYQEYERLKARLEAEGLFDASHKRPLPPYPRCIGIVTSPTAAAFRDVLNILRRRYPLARVLLSPTTVQGDAAPPQIVAALAALNAREDVDVILLVRGGGSLEDLWSFNDERVARAVAASRIPVISGVGHETDFSLADFAADLRAPTPSAAAELATPDREELASRLASRLLQLDRNLDAALLVRRDHVARMLRALTYLSPGAQLSNSRQRVDDLGARIERAWDSRQRLLAQHLAGFSARLEALNPHAVLGRGYAIARHGETGRIITSVKHIAPGTLLRVEVQDGELQAEVLKST